MTTPATNLDAGSGKTARITPGVIWATACVILLSAGASVAGIVLGTALYGDLNAGNTTVANDIVTLAFAVPLLAVSMVLWRTGRRIGVHLWLASLFYFLYTFVPYSIDVPHRVMLAVYLPIVGFATYAGAGLIAGSRAAEPSQESAFIAPGIVLLVLGAFVLVFQCVDLIRVLTDDADSPGSTFGLYIADFVVAVPLLIVAGIQSLRRGGRGALGACAMLLAYASLSTGVVLLLLVQLVSGLAEVAVADFVVMALMTLACLSAYIRLRRGQGQRIVAPVRLRTRMTTHVLDIR